MSDIKLFRTSNKGVSEIQGSAMALEKPLQTLIEDNMEDFLGVRFLASEYIMSGGQIDSLGLDENNSPVILEYKRSKDENIVTQGLFYLDWLMGHRSDFKWLVMERYGQKQAERIDWNAPRVICIANRFTKYDRHAVKQMNRNIELVRYRRFGEELLLFELLTSRTENQKDDRGEGTKYKTIEQTIAGANPALTSLYGEVENYLRNLGDDVRVRMCKYYVAFQRLRNFACVEVKTQRKCIVAYVKVNPAEIELEKEFTRDMRTTSHYGTGDLEIVIKNATDFEKAKPLFERSYDNA